MLQETSRRAFSTLVSPLIKPSSSRLKPSCLPLRPFSSSTPYPLYYDHIHYRPARRHPRPHPNSSPSIPAAAASNDGESSDPMDRAKRRYYRKRHKRMYGNSGSDSDSVPKSDFVELKPEIVEFPRLHAREQELYFHDAFALPWEKDKHYRMVHQLENKFFPDHSFDKAFVDPAAEKNVDDKALLFFDEEKEKEGKEMMEEKKVEEFFRFLKKKAPNVQKGRGDVDVAEEDDACQPFLSCRGTGLPAKWDGPSGTVLLVDKPKGCLSFSIFHFNSFFCYVLLLVTKMLQVKTGWTSFTVCGKLRRLVKVQKVGHAGTLDPMATGLLIVCVGKATKLVEGYQGMAKGYSGVFRLGEATSTWDADSPLNYLMFYPGNKDLLEDGWGELDSSYWCHAALN